MSDANHATDEWNKEILHKKHRMQSFADVETGRVTEELVKLPLDFLVALCR